MIIEDNGIDGTQGAGNTATKGVKGENNGERMKAFFANPVNAVLYPIGNLLTSMVPNADQSMLEKVYGFYRVKKAKDVLKPADLTRIAANMRVNYAQAIAGGDKITLGNVWYAGVKLPLADGGQTLSLETLGAWACPACRSAHGSGVGNSNKGDGPSVKGLMQNRWFYRPADKTIFVISDECFDNYVRALGHRTPARFDVVPTAVPLAPVLALANDNGQAERDTKRAALDAPRKAKG